MSPREYAKTAKFKRRNKAKRYNNSYLPDLYAIESADHKNVNQGLIEYDGMQYGTMSVLNKSIETDGSHEGTFSGKRKSEQFFNQHQHQNNKNNNKK